MQSNKQENHMQTGRTASNHLEASAGAPPRLHNHIVQTETWTTTTSGTGHSSGAEVMHTDPPQEPSINAAVTEAQQRALGRDDLSLRMHGLTTVMEHRVPGPAFRNALFRAVEAANERTNATANALQTLVANRSAEIDNLIRIRAYNQQVEAEDRLPDPEQVYDTEENNEAIRALVYDLLYPPWQLLGRDRRANM
ncbi:hypothetical protein C8Q80DRAFT_1275488 [Daedaleopsis nitida]|nr:hypothetical protein C8Q80DRAFT_1275488 [Daedaleopsis nitida]